MDMLGDFLIKMEGKCHEYLFWELYTQIISELQINKSEVSFLLKYIYMFVNNFYMFIYLYVY